VSTNRPSLTKKHTRTTTENTNAALDAGVEFFIDGNHYKVVFGDLTALDTRALRAQVGMTFPQLLDAVLGQDMDTDVVAAVIWLSRYLEGERNLTYDEVAVTVGYEVIEKIRVGAAAERKRLADEARAAKKTTPAKKTTAKPAEDDDPEG